MKTIAPNYYRRFACIADRCRHSCCIGWEIGIDEETLGRYQSIGGELGQRLRQNIDVTGEGACFRLQGDEERCPFLNERGLCDLILTLGEDALCQICTDHPRFRHFDLDRTEVGLGLCCEAAAQLILLQEEPTVLQAIADDGAVEETDPDELALRHLRDELFSLMQDRSRCAEERAEALCAFAGASLNDFDWQRWIPFLLKLERLDEHWADQLLSIKDAPCGAPRLPHLQKPLEQLMVYFLYRHLHGALEDGNARGRILLCALMWLIVARLWEQHPQDIAECARLCSSELEYSEDNIDALLSEIDSAFFAKNLQTGIAFSPEV